MSISFADYSIPIPGTVEFWGPRYFRSRVDYSLSVGAFDKGKLVAFIINGIDSHQGKLTAFNTGTGVIPAYRGQALVDQLYAYLMEAFKEKAVQKCILEVIDTNKRAIRVYERNGFEIVKRMKCFKGSIAHCQEAVFNERVSFKELMAQGHANQDWYSWDHNDAAMVNAGDFYQCYLVNKPSHDTIGYFIATQQGYVTQMECADEDLRLLLSGIAKVSDVLKTNNVDEARAGLIAGLKAEGIDNFLDQFEMHKTL